MNDTTSGVEIVKTQQDLLGDLTDDVLGHTPVLIALNQAKEILSEHLEHHANVTAVGPLMSEVVQQRDAVPPARVVRISGHHLLQELDLVDSCFCVMGCRFDDFKSNVSIDSVCERQQVRLAGSATTSQQGDHDKEMRTCHPERARPEQRQVHRVNSERD